SPADSARMSAAINLALGQGYNLYTNRMDERWYSLLGKVVRHFARHAKLGGFADQVMNHNQFQQTDDARAIRKETAAILAAEIGKLPAPRVNSMVNWLFRNDPVIAVAQWQKIASGLNEHWQKESNLGQRVQWAGIVISVFRHRGQTDELLAFLRQQLQ